MGMSNPQDELVEEVIALRAKVAELTRVESAIPSSGDSMENDYRADLEEKVVQLKAEVQSLSNENFRLEADLAEARDEVEDAQSERDYYQGQHEDAERYYEDLKKAIVDELVSLLGVPLSDLVTSVNQIITAVESDLLI